MNLKASLLGINLMISCQIDYLQAIGRFTEIKELQEFLNFLSKDLDDKIAILSRKRFWCGMSFDHSFRSVLGIRGGYSLSGNKIRAIIVLSGEYVRLIPHQIEWVKSIQENYPELKITRIDIALDDYERRVKLSQIKVAVSQGNYSLLEKAKGINSKISFSSKYEDTIYFGSPNSNKLIRFYNAETVHDIPADRWEAQFRRQRAELVWQEISKINHSNELAKLVTGTIDFINRNHSVNMRQCPRLHWWQSLLDETDVQYIKVGSQEKSIDRAFEWIDRQVGPTLAMIYEAYGGWEIFEKNMKEWKERQNSYHQVCISQAQEQKP